MMTACETAYRATVVSDCERTYWLYLSCTSEFNTYTGNVSHTFTLTVSLQSPIVYTLDFILPTTSSLCRQT